MSPVVLCVVGGLGQRAATDSNALAEASTPNLDAFPHRSVLKAAGGLELEARGTGEMGFTTLGAGRVVPTQRQRLDALIDGGRFAFHPTVDAAVRQVISEGKLHLVGLLSTDGLHGHVAHLHTIIDHFVFNELDVVVHGIIDGRHAAPRQGIADVDRFLNHYADEPRVTLGTLSGRNYALDAGGHWDRTYRTFHAIVRDRILGEPAPQEDDALEALRGAYRRGVADAWLEPVRIGDYRGVEGNFLADFSSPNPAWDWTGFDVGFVATTRADRSRQLVSMLRRAGLPDEVEVDLLRDRGRKVIAFEPAGLFTLVDHGLDIPCVIPDEPVADNLAITLAAAGKRQARVGETEGARHVGRHFSGYRTATVDGESRLVAQTPRLVEHFEDRPALATDKVTALATDALANHDFVLVHFIAPDAVAHTGDATATVAAIEAVDRAVGRLRDAVDAVGGHLLVTSSHGNVEEMRDDRGDRFPGHTAADVPVWSTFGPLRARGHLQDVAPTLLSLLDLPVPSAMVGAPLHRESEASGPTSDDDDRPGT
ncbi:MAG: alkaline phosphatase family protein [Myxococcota bacterium]